MVQFSHVIFAVMYVLVSIVFVFQSTTTVNTLPILDENKYDIS